MFVVISKFTIDNQNNMTAEVKNAFIARPHSVDKVAGFVRMDVLSPLEYPEQIWLLTYWTDQDSFQQWYRSPNYKESHRNMPANLKLVSHETELLFFQYISS
jgi:heme-degrading monooxygenase HmoA